MKGLLALALVATLLAAGCVSADLSPASTIPTEASALGATAGVVHLANGTIPADLPTTLVAAAGAAFHVGLPASEPTIGATSDGAIYMTANYANPSCDLLPGGCPAVPYANMGRGPTVVKSSDKGQTWQDVYPKLPTGDSQKPRSWDPYVYVDRDTDRVFMDDIIPISCGSLSFSDDGGGSWTTNPYSCGNSHVNDHQTVFTAKPRVLPTVGYQNLVYRCVNNLQYIGCAISPNGGLTFLPQIPVVSGAVGCAAITGHGESDAEGRAYLGFGCAGNVPSVAMTEDDGQTWTISAVSETVPMSNAAHDVELGVDEAGNVFALWEGEDGLYLASSTDHGATWSAPIDITAPGVTMTKFGGLAAGAPGKVAFSYVGTTHPGARELPGAQCGALPAFPCSEPEEWKNATWNAYIGVIEDALAPAPLIQTVMANDPSDPLARGACADRCNGMTDFIDIVIDAEGRPWSSFVDVCVAECVTDASIPFDGNLGIAGTLQVGPALRGPATSLAAILPPPVEAPGEGSA